MDFKQFSYVLLATAALTLSACSEYKMKAAPVTQLNTTPDNGANNVKPDSVQEDKPVASLSILEKNYLGTNKHLIRMKLVSSSTGKYIAYVGTLDFNITEDSNGSLKNENDENAPVLIFYKKTINTRPYIFVSHYDDFESQSGDTFVFLGLVNQLSLAVDSVLLKRVENKTGFSTAEVRNEIASFMEDHVASNIPTQSELAAFENSYGDLEDQTPAKDWTNSIEID